MGFFDIVDDGFWDREIVDLENTENEARSNATKSVINVNNYLFVVFDENEKRKKILKK